MILKSKGVLLLYSENKKLNYKRLADLSARLAECYLDVPVSIIEVKSTQKNIRTFRYDDGIETIEWNNVGRYDAYNLSPYDETLLIDTDYFVQNSNLANYFGSFHNFLCHNTSWDISGNNVSRHDKFLTSGGNGFEMRWATVIYFKKSKHSKFIFDTWRNVCENYDYYSDLIGFKPTPFRNDYALSIAYQICNGYTNNNTFVNLLPALSSTDSVLDYRNKNWLVKYKLKQSYNILRYSGDLHVMNKKCILDTDLYDKLWKSV